MQRDGPPPTPRSPKASLHYPGQDLAVYLMTWRKPPVSLLTYLAGMAALLGYMYVPCSLVECAAYTFWAVLPACALYQWVLRRLWRRPAAEPIRKDAALQLMEPLRAGAQWAVESLGRICGNRAGLFRTIGLSQMVVVVIPRLSAPLAAAAWTAFFSYPLCQSVADPVLEGCGAVVAWVRKPFRVIAHWVAALRGAPQQRGRRG
eukprot:TRINITY_DN34156_c0_g1_i1.p2 TRINITY_DN34156_c0_g1~~TRINITY_DN34156_c0_g1_i1.p2  ORF type:complete len:237 (+),score=69.51 TRINITY_DN34156_c0_g1_i1:100-711(+)